MVLNANRQSLSAPPPPTPPQKKQEIAQLTLYRTLVEDSNLINVIKVLSVIKFDPKCNKRLNSSRITIGRNLDRVA